MISFKIKIWFLQWFLQEEYKHFDKKKKKDTTAKTKSFHT